MLPITKQWLFFVPVSHDRLSVRQCARYKEPETKVAKWNSDIINFGIYNHACPTLARYRRQSKTGENQNDT